MWEEVDDERLFFCCDLCAVQYRGLIDRIKRETGWERLDSIEIAGDRRARTCSVSRGATRARFLFSFNSDGQLIRFQRAEAIDSAAG